MLWVWDHWSDLVRALLLLVWEALQGEDSTPGMLSGWQEATTVHSWFGPEPPKSPRAPPAAMWWFLQWAQDTFCKGRSHSFYFLVSSSSSACFLLYWGSYRVSMAQGALQLQSMEHWGLSVEPHGESPMSARGLKVIIPAYTVSSQPGDPVLAEKSYKCEVLIAQGFVVSHPQATLRFLMFLSCVLKGF